MTKCRVWQRFPARDERGQITAMLVLFTICLLLAIIAVADVSASYLRRQAATSLADGAALAASDGAAAAGVYGGDDQFVIIGQSAAEAAVDNYLRDTGAYAEYPGLQVAVRVEGHTVSVYLSMPYHLPVSVPGVAGTTTIHADGSSVMPIY